jgi:hypothetical protein
MCWTASAQASWEAYQRAGEAAYSRGHYAEAERMLLAAVREARYFGPHDPRLDISLNTLALLRETRDQQANVPPRSQPTARHKAPARQGRVLHRARQPQPARAALQRARPGRHQQALRSRRPTHRPVPSVRHAKRQQSVRRESFRRAPQLRRGQQLQRPGVTIRRAGPKHPGRRARRSLKRRAARSPRRAMLHAGPPRSAQRWLQQRAMA